MIRAIRPEAVAEADAWSISGWNILPNVSYTVRISTTSVELWDAANSACIATGVVENVGTDQPIVLTPEAGQELGMLDLELGWHIRVNIDAARLPVVIPLDPMVDLPGLAHPIYDNEALSLAKARAAILDGTHLVQDVTVLCPQGLDVGLGDGVGVEVGTEYVKGRMESVTWTATPDGTSATALVRSRTSLSPVQRFKWDLWLDALDADTFTTQNGYPVWMDKSGHNRHARRAYSNPFELGTDGGFPHMVPPMGYGDTVRVDGLTAGLPPLRYMPHNSSPWTIAVVGSLLPEYGVYRETTMCGMDTYAGAHVRKSVFYREGNFVCMQYYQSPIFDHPVTTRFVGVFSHFGRAIDMATITENTNMRSWVNGLQCHYANRVTAWNPMCGIGGGVVDPYFYIGAPQATAGGSGGCRLNEVILICRTVSTRYRHLLEGYLAHKWGIAGALPASHPYKNIAVNVDVF